MKKFIALFLLIVAINGCGAATQQGSGFSLDNWTLIKSHQVVQGEPLYASFGPIIYDIYMNPVLINSRNKTSSLPINSEVALIVYSGERNLKKIAFTGVFSKNKAYGSGEQWKITAYDSSNNAFEEQQVATQCRACHNAGDDKIILGTYK